MLHYAEVATMRAMMTFEPDMITQAVERLKAAKSLANTNSGAGGWGTTAWNAAAAVGGMVWRSKQTVESEKENWQIECQAVVAECYLLLAILHFLRESMSEYVKGGYSLHKSWSSFHWCHAKLQKLGADQCEPSLRGCIDFGIGCFNLLVSLTPPSVLRLVEVIGFSGDRDYGLQLLNAAHASKSLRSSLASVFLIQYHTVLCAWLPYQEVHATESQRILDDRLGEYPQAGIFLLLAGRVARYKRDLAEAARMYESALTVQGKEFQQLSHICWYELGWAKMLQLDWAGACQYWERLLEESRWSKSFYGYLLAACKFEAGFRDEAIRTLGTLPSLCQRKFLGQPIPVEAFVLQKCSQFQDASCAMPCASSFRVLCRCVCSFRARMCCFAQRLRDSVLLERVPADAV